MMNMYLTGCNGRREQEYPDTCISLKWMLTIVVKKCIAAGNEYIMAAVFMHSPKQTVSYVRILRDNGDDISTVEGVFALCGA